MIEKKPDSSCSSYSPVVLFDSKKRTVNRTSVVLILVFTSLGNRKHFKTYFYVFC